ncbi:MAG: alpha/beta hydrolase [Proteobacteria bacterium]|nr:alpha/beta hydrolase [Pseudomonadota bacterium]
MSYSIWSATQTVLIYTIIGYALIVIGFFLISDSVLYQPPQATYQDSSHIVKIPLPNGKKISSIYLTNTNAKYTILFSHGNAEDLGTLNPLLMLFRDKGYNILAYDYEGYGTSNGFPSEKNTYQDIQAAYDYLIQTLHVSPDNIIVYGRSLGSGPSIYLAAKNKIKALIIESAFISAYRVQTSIPFVLFDKYPNLQRISQVHVPLLIIHGINDSIVPLWHGKKLANAANQPVQTYWVKGADHNNLIFIAQNNYWKIIQNFVQQLGNSEKS